MKIPFKGHIPNHLGHLEHHIIEFDEDAPIYLHWHDDRLWLARSKERFCLDLVSDWYYHYKNSYSLAKEPLAKALGIKGNPKLPVWDLTCGLGKDSLLMLSFGAQVVAFERDPVTAALLMDGVKRGMSDRYLAPVLEERFELHFMDGTEYLGADPRVIYLDPMYQFKNKSAKPTLGMELLRERAGEAQSGQSLLDWALTKDVERVVIKRAIRAPSMNPIPKVVYRGKSTRYDMYIPREVADFN